MLAFARESLDDRIRSSRDAEEWFGAPVVGTLPKPTRGARPAGVAGTRHETEGLLEAMNLLRANLEFSPNGVAGPTILVTSALAREGKTTVAANLASVLAMGGHNVICVEADARRPALRGYMGVPAQTEGLLEVLNGDVDLDGALQTRRTHWTGQRRATKDGSRAQERRPTGGAAGSFRRWGATSPPDRLLLPRHGHGLQRGESRRH